MSQCFQYQKLQRKIRRSQIAEVEAEIARLEATMKMYEVQLANPVVQQDLDEMSKISIQIEETQTELDSLYEKWERLCE